ncbi:hypothetical protein ACFL0X_01260 [Nanoarchaeota archaeon]
MQIDMNQIDQELKSIRETMVTREDLNRLIETIAILSNPETMEQINASQSDIESGRIKEINTIDEI